MKKVKTIGVQNPTLKLLRNVRIEVTLGAILWAILTKFSGLMGLLRFDYRQHCAQRKAPVFNLLRGRF